MLLRVIAVLLLSAGVAGAQQRPLRVATWNLENFYDVYDDPWREDEVTRPAFTTDARKERIAGVLKQLDADVVCLEEVENRFVLEDFVDRFLPGGGYRVVLVEGNDGRGIDVALLSRLPVGTVTSYRNLEFEDAAGVRRRFQRDLLRVRVAGRLQADVYVVHLKSQRGGDEADRIRAAEARAAAGIVAAELAADPGYRALVAGDFNDVAGSPPLEAFLRAGLTDACAGSQAVSYHAEPYRSRIDFLLFTPALAAELESARIEDSEAARASSDHLPVSAVLKASGGG